MEVIENLRVKEKVYKEKLENGLTVMIIPKKNFQKKYVIWGTHFGSIDNEFVLPKTNETVKIPDGVAHFLEHKMFEQENGINSLDVLSSLGVEANAYTTNDHTAYLFEATDNFYEALDELMDYVQHPFFTDENVEKEKGIIGQEITMYDDQPGWQVYMNAMKCMYNKNPIRIDIAGTIESISKINKEVLYNCYETFYHPSNMAMVICGDFLPQEILKEVKQRLIIKEGQAEIRRIYPEEDKKIAKSKIEKTMEVSNPLFMIGYKDNIEKDANKVKKHIAIQVLLELLLGASSTLYKQMYEQGYLLSQPDLDYEFSNEYAHVSIAGNSNNPELLANKLDEQINYFIENGIPQEDFERIKKKIYGQYVTEYDSVSGIARMFLSDYFKGISSFDYLENYNLVTLEYTMQILKEVFKKENKVLSIIKG